MPDKTEIRPDSKMSRAAQISCQKWAKSVQCAPGLSQRDAKLTSECKLRSGCKLNEEFRIIEGICIAVNIESKVRAVRLFSSHISPNGYTSSSVESVNVQEQSVLPRKKKYDLKT